MSQENVEVSARACAAGRRRVLDAVLGDTAPTPRRAVHGRRRPSTSFRGQDRCTEAGLEGMLSTFPDTAWRSAASCDSDERRHRHAHPGCGQEATSGRADLWQVIWTFATTSVSAVRAVTGASARPSKPWGCGSRRCRRRTWRSCRSFGMIATGEDGTRSSSSSIPSPSGISIRLFPRGSTDRLPGSRPRKRLGTTYGFRRQVLQAEVE